MARTRHSRPDRRRGPAFDWVDLRFARRAIPVVLIAALLFAVTLRTSIAEVFQSNNPIRALAWNPDHARASATLARRAVIGGHVEEGRRLALRSIARDPLDATAYSALALAAESTGRARRASDLMALSHKISRREWVTEVWLIRQSIGKLDYAAAIRHFDIAMRTSSRGVPDLMPLLVASTVDPRMIAALNPVLAREPTWKSSFLMSLAIGAPNAADVVKLSRGRLDPQVADERAVISQLIQRLVNERRYDLAWSVYRDARPGTSDQAAASLRDTGYGASAGFPPFDWQLSEDPELTALRETRRDGRPGFALALVAEGGRTGEVARQLVRLAPGVHRLQFVAGAVPADGPDRPQISLTCGGVAEPIYRIRPSEGAPGAQRVRGTFSVPAGCRWQTLSISIGSNETPVESPWIADIIIDGRPPAG